MASSPLLTSRLSLLQLSFATAPSSTSSSASCSAARGALCISNSAAAPIQPRKTTAATAACPKSSTKTVVYVGGGNSDLREGVHRYTSKFSGAPVHVTRVSAARTTRPRAASTGKPGVASSPRSSLVKQRQGLKLRRSPSKGLTTTVLDLQYLRAERNFLIFARNRDDNGPSLNRNEVVELLSDAVQMLLKPENQKLLRERLEKSKQRSSLQQSKLLEQQSNVDQWNSPAPTNCLQDLEVIHSEMEGDTIDSGSYPYDQVSQMTTSVTIPITSQMTELVESQEQPRNIENHESPTESVDSKERSSLTSIRRLKVLDVHSYVHKALRESALRSWLNSRTIEE